MASEGKASGTVPWTGIVAVLVVGAVAAGGYYLTREEPVPPPPPLPTLTVEIHALPGPRSTTTILSDGSLLVSGGAGPAQRFTPGSGWSDVAAAADLPPEHEALDLGENQLFVVGGVRDFTKLGDAAIVDLKSGERRDLRALPGGLSGHAVVLMKDGRIFVGGGNPRQSTDEEEPSRKAYLYDRDKDDWRITFDMAEPKVDHVARGLDDGTVLMAGGRGSRNAMVYLPDIDEWRAKARTQGLKTSGTVMLSDGRVLITREGDHHPPQQAEIYDHAKSEWIQAGALSHGGIPTLAACPDGSAVAIYAPAPDPNATEDAPPLPAVIVERLDPKGPAWNPVAALSPAPELPGQTASLPDGTIVLLDASGTKTMVLSCGELRP